MGRLLRRFAAVLLAAALCGCQYVPGAAGGSALATPEPADRKPAEQEPQLLGRYLNPPAPDFAAYDKTTQAKGIYVTANIVGIPEYFETRLALCEETELNAMVIDIKNDEGNITVKNKIPLADELGVAESGVGDIDALLADLKSRGVYAIARVVVFKDSAVYEARPDLAIQMTKPGYSGVYRARVNGKDTGPVWLNPYNRDVWDYYVALSQQIAALGFDEIQYDYIRFPTDANVQYADYGDTGDISKIDIINAFSAYVCDALAPYPIRLSADIFATVIDSDLDASLIGQDPIALSKIFDIVCPMVYPSHYAPGSLGLTYPDLEPYETVCRAMTKLLARQKDEIPEGEHVAIVRPWIQDFSFSGTGHMAYGAEEVRAEIQGVYDAGLAEWLLWNAANKYTRDALLPKE